MESWYVSGIVVVAGDWWLITSVEGSWTLVLGALGAAIKELRGCGNSPTVARYHPRDEQGVYCSSIRD